MDGPAVSLSASTCSAQPEDRDLVPVWPAYLSSRDTHQTIPSSLPGRMCMHCPRPLDHVQPIPIAVSQQSYGVFNVRNVYCCPQCALAGAEDYDLRNNTDVARKLTRNMLVLCFNVPNTPTHLCPALPREVLIVYGGTKTLDEFHATTTLGKPSEATPLPLCPHIDIISVRRRLARYENGVRQHHAPFERETLIQTPREDDADVLADERRDLEAYARRFPARKRAELEASARALFDVRSLDYTAPEGPEREALENVCRRFGAFGVAGRTREEVIRACAAAALARVPLIPRAERRVQSALEEALGEVVEEHLATEDASPRHVEAVVRRCVRVLLGEEEGWEQLVTSGDGEVAGEVGLHDVVTLDRISCWERGVRPENGMIVHGLRRPPPGRCIKVWTSEMSVDRPMWDEMLEAARREARVRDEEAPTEQRAKVRRVAQKKHTVKTSKRIAAANEKQEPQREAYAKTLMSALGIPGGSE